MRKIFLYAACLCSLATLAQDATKIKQIDSVVAVINKSKYKIQTDTVDHDPAITGLTMVRYLTISKNGTELKKHVTDAHVTTDDGKQSNTIATFYFDHNELIKVEEYTVDNNPKKETLWYFANGKPIHYTVKSDRSQEMAETLLRIAKGMLEKYGSK